MAELTIEYPDDLLVASGKPRKAVEDELRVVLAMKLFELGQFSLGKAAERLEWARCVSWMSWAGCVFRSSTLMTLKLRRRCVPPEEIIIADSSPLIGLARIAMLPLLPKLARRIVVPPAVRLFGTRTYRGRFKGRGGIGGKMPQGAPPGISHSAHSELMICAEDAAQHPGINHAASAMGVSQRAALSGALRARIARLAARLNV